MFFTSTPSHGGSLTRADVKREFDDLKHVLKESLGELGTAIEDGFRDVARTPIPSIYGNGKHDAARPSHSDTSIGLIAAGDEPFFQDQQGAHSKYHSSWESTIKKTAQGRKRISQVHFNVNKSAFDSPENGGSSLASSLFPDFQVKDHAPESLNALTSLQRKKPLPLSKHRRMSALSAGSTDRQVSSAESFTSEGSASRAPGAQHGSESDEDHESCTSLAVSGRNLSFGSPRDSVPLSSLRASNKNRSGHALLAQTPLQQPESVVLEQDHLLEWSPTRPLDKRWLHSMVESKCFIVCSSLCVVLNCVAIGLEADASVSGAAYPCASQIALAFCAFFVIELTLRICAVGFRDFLCGHVWKWNLFDSGMLFLQVLDEADRLMLSQSSTNFAVLRMLRLFRITRILRVLRASRGLSTIVFSMIDAFSSLAWTMLLLFMLIYICAILCLDFIAKAGGVQELEHHTEVEYFYGSLARAMLTLLQCINGGVGWDRAVHPLMTDIGAFMGFGFIIYVIIACYALTNMMTGMFVQKAMHCATTTHDNSQAEGIRDLVFSRFTAEGGISWPGFQELVNTSEMKEYFEDLNVDMSDSKHMFDLLDEEGSEVLDLAGFVNGCLRLRGPAKALELSLLTKQVEYIVETIDAMACHMTLQAEDDMVQIPSTKRGLSSVFKKGID